MCVKLGTACLTGAVLLGNLFSIDLAADWFEALRVVPPSFLRLAAGPPTEFMEVRLEGAGARGEFWSLTRDGATQELLWASPSYGAGSLAEWKLIAWPEGGARPTVTEGTTSEFGRIKAYLDRLLHLCRDLNRFPGQDAREKRNARARALHEWLSRYASAVFLEVDSVSKLEALQPQLVERNIFDEEAELACVLMLEITLPRGSAVLGIGYKTYIAITFRDQDFRSAQSIRATCNLMGEPEIETLSVELFQPEEFSAPEMQLAARTRRAIYAWLQRRQRPALLARAFEHCSAPPRVFWL